MSFDPLTILHDEIWNKLEDSAEFCSLVKEGNRLKLGGERGLKIKDQIQEADVPEVRIVCTGITPHLHQTSSSSSVQVNFDIGIATGELRLTANRALFPVAWAIIGAVATAIPIWTDVTSGIKWQGETFARNIKLANGSVGVSDSDLNRGIKGWTSITQLECQLWFTTSEVMA